MTLNRLAVALALVNLALLVSPIVQVSAINAAPETQPLLRAQLIELVDARGVMRGQLKTEDDGDVVFRLRDRNGTVRVKLGANEMGSGLLLADDQTDVGVHILSGISKLTNERNTMITLAEPGNVKRVIRPRE
jgi:hypothetical protein